MPLTRGHRALNEVGDALETVQYLVGGLELSEQLSRVCEDILEGGKVQALDKLYCIVKFAHVLELGDGRGVAHDKAD